MRLLLDTHILLWAAEDSPQLPLQLRAAISQAEEIHVSVASFWELAIKQAAGRIEIPLSQLPLLFEYCLSELRAEPLQIDFEHAFAVAKLPQHHRDPFDRILVAQAIVEGLTLVTHDRQLGVYPCSTLC